MFKKILNFIFYVVYIILISFILFTIYLNLQKQMSKNELVDIFGYRAYIITSSSMEPNIKVDDVVIVNSKAPIKANDVIVFSKNHMTITHRVVEMIENMENTEYITKGDNNPTNDKDPVLNEEIMGKVVFCVPYIGTYINMLHTPTGILFSIVVPAFLLFLYYFQKTILDYKNEVKNQKHK